MLYIFHVDTGRMMTFEMNFTLESVQTLKHTIEQQHKIPASNQVLLISGGEMLQLNQCVGSYSAGTDTNPIFMFSTAIMDARNQIEPWPSIDKDKDKKDSEHELKIQVDHCLDLPNTYQTVVARAQLSQQIHEMAKTEIRECEELVHEQHLQQQGWAAVVANMEDLTNEFRERSEDFYRHFNEYLLRREEYIEFLTHFSDDLSKLANIPILPGLVHNAEERPFDAFNEVFKDGDHYSKYDSSSSGNDKSDTSDTSVSCAKRQRLPSVNFGDDGKHAAVFTLMHWILATENQKSLRDMAENCRQGLEKLNQTFLDEIKADAQRHIDSAQREDMKEIKGLGDRLYGLERIMCDAKECVQEQNVLSQAFQQNQNRAANLGDTSILPDLCASHRGQLLVMVKNHNKLKDIRRRCSKCKDELGENIHKRLKYIVCLENKMSELDNKLLFYHRCVKRLQKHLGIIEQIHHAPCIYVTAVTEVVRRRIFSSAFLMWASNLACHLLTIHNDEVMRRQDFATTFEGHFLCTLFPGMDDMPPTYATEAPLIFDSSLPNLSENDIKELSHFLPELTSKVQLPDLGAVIEFFSSRSGRHDRNNSSSSDAKETSMTDDLKQRLPSTKPIDIHSHLKEYEKGFESETDTEEFEKLTQSPSDKQQTSHQAAKTVISMATSTSANDFLQPMTCSTSTSTDRVATQSTETLTEDNLGTTRLEVERLKTLLKTVYDLSHGSLAILKDQLANIKSQTADDRQEISQQIEKLSQTYLEYNNEIDGDTKCKERERIQRLTVDHELEMNDIKTSLLRKDDEIQTLQNEKSEMETRNSDEVVRHAREKVALDKSLDLLQERVGQLERQVAEAKRDREMAVKEVRDRLQYEHKTEMESLRCKFKLMTNLERSPSDTSLEKIERPDVIEIASHKAILEQVKQKCEAEKEQALRAALDRQSSRLDLMRSSQVTLSSSPRSPTTNSDMYKRILDEKERQLDQLREREEHLTKENRRFKDQIQSLADSDITGSQVTEMSEKLESVKKEKHRLEQELEKEKRKRAKLTQNQINTFVRNGTFTITSCAEGANVLVVWNFHHEQYIVAQDSPVLYFLHAESYPALNLNQTASGQTPVQMYCFGIVETKEYCHARRDENRYKVTKGTKFYRVKVQPRHMSSRSETERSCSHRKERKSSTSEPVSRSMSTETCNPAGLLIDSFAQTENLVPLLEDSTTSRDMIDSGVVEQRMFYKERNISVTEEDEPTSLILEHLRCESVSEEITLTTGDAGNDEADGREPTTILLDTSSDSTKLEDSDDFRSLEL